MHLDKTLFLDKGQNYISRVLSDQPTIWNQGSSIFFSFAPYGSRTFIIFMYPFDSKELYCIQ